MVSWPRQRTPVPGSVVRARDQQCISFMAAERGGGEERGGEREWEKAREREWRQQGADSCHCIIDHRKVALVNILEAFMMPGFLTWRGKTRAPLPSARPLECVPGSGVSRAMPPRCSGVQNPCAKPGGASGAGTSAGRPGAVMTSYRGKLFL